MGIMSQEELDRYELFRRSKLSKAVLKRVCGGLHLVPGVCLSIVTSVEVNAWGKLHGRVSALQSGIVEGGCACCC